MFKQSTSIQSVALAVFACVALWLGKVDSDTALALLASSGVLAAMNEKRGTPEKPE